MKAKFLSRTSGTSLNKQRSLSSARMTVKCYRSSFGKLGAVLLRNWRHRMRLSARRHWKGMLIEPWRVSGPWRTSWSPMGNSGSFVWKSKCTIEFWFVQCWLSTVSDATTLLRDMAGDVSQEVSARVRPSEKELSQVGQPEKENVWHEKPAPSKRKQKSQRKKRKSAVIPTFPAMDYESVTYTKIGQGRP